MVAGPQRRGRCSVSLGSGGGGFRKPPNRARAVVEVPSRPTCARIGGVPLGAVALDDVVGVEGRAVVERHALAEVERPLRQVVVGLPALGERRLDLGAADLVRSSDSTICSQTRSASPSVSSAQYSPPGSPFCTNTNWSWPPACITDEALVGQRAGVGADDVGLVGHGRAAVGDRDHRDVLLDQRVGLRRRGRRGSPRRWSGRPRRSTSTMSGNGVPNCGDAPVEVVVDEVRGIREVGAPPEQVERQVAGVGVVDERRRLLQVEGDVDADRRPAGPGCRWPPRSAGRGSRGPRRGSSASRRARRGSRPRRAAALAFVGVAGEVDEALLVAGDRRRQELRRRRPSPAGRSCRSRRWRSMASAIAWRTSGSSNGGMSTLKPR